jgi:hypothetical protein
MNIEPDYSAAYVALETDHPDGLAGHGRSADSTRRSTGVIGKWG